MKKIFATLILMATIVNTLPLFAGEYLEDAAWTEMRILHSEYLERPNNMTHGETEMWIAQQMNKWLKEKQNEYKGRIRTLEEENRKLRTENSTRYRTLSGNTQTGEDDSNTGASVIELKKANNELENKFNRCKIERNIAYSVIAIILMLFIAFILIKKCQAKKLPKVIEEAIASQDK